MDDKYPYITFLENKMQQSVYFKITVPGTTLDEKRFYEYSDVATTYPTYEQSLAKAIAFIKMDELKKALTTVDTLTHLEIKHTTAGSAVLVPTGTTIVVDYKSLENLVKSRYNTTEITGVTSKAQLETMAITVLKSFVDKVFSSALVVALQCRHPVACRPQNQNKSSVGQ
jgi:predicted metalloendopeptidase